LTYLNSSCHLLNPCASSSTWKGNTHCTPQRRKRMDDHMSAPFCLGDALWKAMPPQADRPGQRHDAAIRPTACVAACCWRGPQASARARRPPPGALPPLVRQSRGRRRRHRMQALGLLLGAVGGQPWQTRHPAARSVMERFPRAGGDQRRLRRATRAAAETLRGAPARPHRSVSGLTMPRLGPPDGQPVAWCLPPGGWGDVEALPDEAEALPEGARRDAEKADNEPRQNNMAIGIAALFSVFAALAAYALAPRSEMHRLLWRAALVVDYRPQTVRATHTALSCFDMSSPREV